MKAVVTKFETIPYSVQEQDALPRSEKDRIRFLGQEKVVGEQIIEEIIAESIDQFRKRIVELCNLNHPTPLIIIGAENPSGLFLIETRYNPKDTNSLMEIVLYKSAQDRIEMKKMRPENTKNTRKLPYSTEDGVVVCRIIGKDRTRVSNAMRYYLNKHSIERSLSATTNEIFDEPGLWKSTSP